MSAQGTVIIETVTTSEAETLALAGSFAREHNLVKSGGIVTLSGELGAGKTRFIKGVVAAMGGDADDVNSPTYTIVNEYETPNGTVGHMDAYRLSGEDELETIGWDELLERCTLVLIEWAERIEGALPGALPGATPGGGQYYHVCMTHMGEHDRRIVVSRIEG